jgi:hypothetical protein
MPSNSELMAITGLRSNHAVCTHVERLLDLTSCAHAMVGYLLKAGQLGVGQVR